MFCFDTLCSYKSSILFLFFSLNPQWDEGAAQRGNQIN